MRVLISLLTGALFLAWLLVLRPTVLGGPASYIVVSGVSMEPTLYTGDLAILLQQDDYQVGDVVAFDAEGRNVIHRIVGGSRDEGFVMQGDNRNATDPWQPRGEQVLGRMWLHVPGVGAIMASLRQPQRLWPLIAAGAALMLLTGAGTTRRTRRRRGMAMAEAPIGGPRQPGFPATLLTLLILCASTAAASGLLVMFSFGQPTTVAETVQSPRYEHTAVYDYRVEVQASTLYPDGAVPSSGSSGGVGQQVHARLAHGIDLGLAYALQTDRPADVSGEIGASLRLKSSDGWERPVDVLPSTPFQGTRGAARFRVDLDRVQELIAAIEKETSSSPGFYTLDVVPRVTVRGTLGGQSVDDTYAPVFSVRITRGLITLDPALTRSEPRTASESVQRDRKIGGFGFSLAVASARQVGLVGLAVSLALAAGAGLFLWRRLRGSERARIRLRHGGSLVDVTRVNVPDEHGVEVASMADLVRLAKRDGGIILHQELGPGESRYLVLDSGTMYEYRVKETTARQQTAADGEAARHGEEGRVAWAGPSSQ